MADQEETNVWKRALIKYSKLGYKLYRNQRYVGPIVRKGKITKAWADCGLHDGFGDLLGWKSIVITADMVGKKIAQLCMFEAKTEKGTLRKEQETVRDIVINDGGIYEVIRPKDVK